MPQAGNSKPSFQKSLKEAKARMFLFLFVDYQALSRLKGDIGWVGLVPVQNSKHKLGFCQKNGLVPPLLLQGSKILRVRPVWPNISFPKFTHQLSMPYFPSYSFSQIHQVCFHKTKIMRLHQYKVSLLVPDDSLLRITITKSLFLLAIGGIFHPGYSHLAICLRLMEPHC